MNRNDFIKKFPVGSKVRLEGSVENYFFEVLYHGEQEFFGKMPDGREMALSYQNGWLPYEEHLKLFDVVMCTEFLSTKDGYGILIEANLGRLLIKVFFPESGRIETFNYFLNGDSLPIKKVKDRVAMAPASWEDSFGNKNGRREWSDPVSQDYVNEFYSKNQNMKDLRWPHNIASLTIEVVK